MSSRYSYDGRGEATRATMITIHCGLHKTGSSSIQLGLRLSGQRQRPIVLPQPGESQSDDAWATKLRALPPRVIVSNENILGSPFDGYARAPERLRLIDASLSGRDYQFIVYFRPQLPWFQSVYLQGIQQGMDDSPDDFISRVTSSPYVHWQSLLELLRGSNATSVIARVYLSSRDVVTDFFAQAALGSPPDVGAAGFRENPSITAVQAPILRALNAGADSVDSARLRELFQGTLRMGAPHGLSPFSVDLQQACLDRFHRDWSALTEAVTSVDASEGAVFSEILAAWHQGAAHCAGEHVTDPLVATEMVRSIGVLASASTRESGGMGARAMRAIADPARVAASLRRRTLGRQH